MEVPEETLQQLRSIKSDLDDLEEHMQPFLETSPKEMNAQLTPIERVKANLALAQAVVVLYQLHRRLAAAKLDNHPINKELERLAVYERKVAAAINSNDLARTRPGTSLNVAAANRFIDAAIPDLTVEQKQQLRSLGKRAATDAAAGSAGASKRKQQQQQASLVAGDGRGDQSDDNAVAAPAAPGSGGGSSAASKPSKGGLVANHRSRAAAAEEEAQEFLSEVLADLQPSAS